MTYMEMIRKAKANDLTDEKIINAVKEEMKHVLKDEFEKGKAKTSTQTTLDEYIEINMSMGPIWMLNHLPKETLHEAISNLCEKLKIEEKREIS